MKETLHISVSAPCGENWDGMDKRDHGRYCDHCQKTVIDFTGMTDAEVLRHFSGGLWGAGAGSRAGSGAGVCGRFLAEQLERPLVPAPVQRNGWSGWRWLLASMLVVGKPPVGGRPAKAPVVERRNTTGRGVGVAATTTVSDDFYVHAKKIKRRVQRAAADSDRVWKPTVVRVDSFSGIEAPVKLSTVSELTERGLTGSFRCIAGGISIKRVRTDSNLLRKVVDTVKTVIGLGRADFVTVFPNPVERGGVLHLAWLTETGRFQLSLFTMRGALAVEKVVEVRGGGQTDQWIMPLGLAAGIYVLRVVGEGGRVDVKEVVVR